MKKILLLLVLFFCGISSVCSQEKRNLLGPAAARLEADRGWLGSDRWITFPTYEDRDGWESIPSGLRNDYIRRAERYIGYGWPAVRATDYLDFSRSGDRQQMERVQGERIKALRALALAELMEGRGRFMDDLVNGVFSFCQQTYWGLSACLYMHQRGKTQWDSRLGETNLPDVEDPIIDLWVGEVGADLAWIYYLFKEEFDRVTPVLARRLRTELGRRILEPFYTRDDYWWITGWGKGAVNNWTPWCNHNVLTVILLIEDDPAKKQFGILKTMRSVDLFYNAYPTDGACEEGPNYWGAAGGRAFDYLSMLYRASAGRIDIFHAPIIGDIGRYIYRVYISGGDQFVNFADSPAKIEPRSALIYRYGRQIGDPVMENFGVYLLQQRQAAGKVPEGTLGNVLDELFMGNEWQHRPGAEPNPGSFYFPDVQIAVAREKEGSRQGFYFAAKGGNNAEAHNHNDVGSAIILYDGQPVFVDPGVGTYTRATFEEGRYAIWTMQSDYHNLPRINGFSQRAGSRFCSEQALFRNEKQVVEFSLDISKAYPEQASVRSWRRSYRIDRGKALCLSDRFELDRVVDTTQLRFVTPLDITLKNPGRIVLRSKNVCLHLDYDPLLLTPRIERVDIRDPKLTRVWGEHLGVLILDVAPVRTGTINLVVKAVDVSENREN